MINYKELIQKAKEARKKSYSPYSEFCVGAALLTDENKIYQGCNIENAAFSPSTCAERTAFLKAVYEGERSFKAIAIVGKSIKIHKEDITNEVDTEEGENPCFPCGVCLQVMIEFCDVETFQIVVAQNTDDYQVYKLKELMPMSFKGTIMQRYKK